MHTLINQLKMHMSSMDQSSGHPYFGIVSSYDPATHRVRVIPQPADPDLPQRLSGWLPICTPNLGSGWGIVCPPAIGEQILIVPDSGDQNHGIALGSIFSNVSKPPQPTGNPVQSGEIAFVHASGSFVYLHSDGSVDYSSQGDSRLTSTTGKILIDATNDDININSDTHNINVSAPKGALNLSGVQVNIDLIKPPPVPTGDIVFGTPFSLTSSFGLSADAINFSTTTGTNVSGDLVVSGKVIATGGFSGAGGDFLGVTDLGNVSAAITIDTTLIQRFTMTLVNDAAITLTNASGTGYISVLFAITQGNDGSYSLTYPPNFRWQGGFSPSLSTSVGATDILQALSFDGGATWLAAIALQAAP